VTAQQIKAQDLLLEWHRLRSSGVCAFILDIQERKDRLENLAALLSAEMYCSSADNLELICSRFEKELDNLRQKVFVDLIAGLQTTK
jgi:hypothetical protein